MLPAASSETSVLVEGGKFTLKKVCVNYLKLTNELFMKKE